jgi:membrane protein YqaA with SNARE-associated domain
VHEELRKAQQAAIRSEERGKNLIKKVWRKIGVTSSVLAPGLAAIPDNLCILNGGLAVIFSVRYLFHCVSSKSLTE